MKNYADLISFFKVAESWLFGPGDHKQGIIASI